MNRTLNIGCKIISFLILLTLFANYQTVSIMLMITTDSSTKIILVSLTMLMVALNILAALGMYLIKRWGFFFGYFAIPFTTIAFSLCYIPFVDKLFSMQGRMYFMLLANILVMIFIIHLNVFYHRNKKALQK